MQKKTVKIKYRWGQPTNNVDRGQDLAVVWHHPIALRDGQGLTVLSTNGSNSKKPTAVINGTPL